MKKITLSLMAGVILLAALCLHPFSALAAEAAPVLIPVEIEGGGTAEVIPEVNCPLPEESSIEVPNGMTEYIHITFSEAGTYFYTVQAASKDELRYAPVYYTAEVTVKQNADGTLDAITVLTKADSLYKLDACVFVRDDSPYVNPSQPVETQPVETLPVTPTQPPKNPPTSRPKTGDDSMLDIYLLICIVASGGLFALSVVYSVSTNRLINRSK